MNQVMNDPSEACMRCGAVIDQRDLYCEKCKEQVLTQLYQPAQDEIQLQAAAERLLEFNSRAALVVERVHPLKSWPAAFQATVDGLKTFDLRSNDRGFQVGDILLLQEYDPDPGRRGYTGRSIRCQVSYILFGGQFGLPQGYVIMAIRRGVQGEEGWQYV